MCVLCVVAVFLSYLVCFVFFVNKYFVFLLDVSAVYSCGLNRCCCFVTACVYHVLSVFCACLINVFVFLLDVLLLLFVLCCFVFCWCSCCFVCMFLFLDVRFRCFFLIGFGLGWALFCVSNVYVFGWIVWCCVYCVDVLLFCANVFFVIMVYVFRVLLYSFVCLPFFLLGVSLSCWLLCVLVLFFG